MAQTYIWTVSRDDKKPLAFCSSLQKLVDEIRTWVGVPGSTRTCVNDRWTLTDDFEDRVAKAVRRKPTLFLIRIKDWADNRDYLRVERHRINNGVDLMLMK